MELRGKELYCPVQKARTCPAEQMLPNKLCVFLFRICAFSKMFQPCSKVLPFSRWTVTSALTPDSGRVIENWRELTVIESDERVRNDLIVAGRCIHARRWARVQHPCPWSRMLWSGFLSRWRQLNYKQCSSFCFQFANSFNAMAAERVRGQVKRIHMLVFCVPCMKFQVLSRRRGLVIEV